MRRLERAARTPPGLAILTLLIVVYVLVIGQNWGWYAAALLALAALYIVTWGQNWTTYAGALMIRAVLTHDHAPSGRSHA